MLTVTGSPSTLDPQLLDAYRQTRYVVEDESPFVLSIGEFSEPLAAVHRRFGAACSVYLTAYNPQSRIRSAAENRIAQQRLQSAIASRGLPMLEGRGESVGGEWPPEASVLVPGMSQRDGLSLARTYAQNAIVVAGADAIPRLLLLR